MNRIWGVYIRRLSASVALGFLATLWIGSAAVAAPITVEFRSEDLGKVEFSGLAKVKIDGVTETHPLADTLGFVTLPADLTMDPATVQLTAKFADQATYGPFTVPVVPGKVRALTVDTGGQASGSFPTTRIQLLYSVADLDIAALDQVNAAIDARVKIKLTGLTEGLPGADGNGFVQLPLALPKVLLTQSVEVRSLVDGVLNFGPNSILLEYKKVKVYNYADATLSTGAASTTQLRLKYNTASLPLLSVTALDLVNDPIGTGRSRIKIVGFTETMAGADLDGFVPVPVSIPNISSGTYSVSVKLDNALVGGPYGVGITLGDLKEIKVVDGTANNQGPSTSTKLILRHQVADLRLFAENQNEAEINDGSVKGRIPGITDGLAGADGAGFVTLPVTLPKVRIAAVTATWKYNNLLQFGPFTTAVAFQQAKVLNQNGGQFKEGGAATSSLGLHLDLNALPLLEVRSVDLDLQSLPAGRARVKIAGVTGLLAGADADSFVSIPADIPNLVTGTYSVSAKLDGIVVGGPYPIDITQGSVREIKAFDGASNSSGPYTSTRLVLQYRVMNLNVFAQTVAGVPITDGSVKARIAGVALPGADGNGFAPLPAVAPKVWIAGFTITWKQNDSLVFGPFATAVKFGNSGLLNMDGTIFGAGAAPQTAIGLRLDLSALPLLEVRTKDLDGAALAAGRSRIKIAGVTGSLAGADADSFVAVPVDIQNLTTGTYTVTTKLDGHAVGGPYSVNITQGSIREIKASDGSSNLNGPFTSTRLVLQYRVANLSLFAENSNQPVKAKIPGVTESMPGADTNGFVTLPAVAPKVWLTSVNITFLYNDLLVFGPYLTPIDSYNDVKVLNMDGTEFGTGEGTATGLGMHFVPSAVPLLEVRSIDLDLDPLAAGRGRIKIDGVTGSLAGADADSFVTIPVDIANFTTGTYTVSVKLDGNVIGGPYGVAIAQGDHKEIKAADGSANSGGPSTSTRLTIQYRVADLELFAQNSAQPVKAKIAGLTDVVGYPGADANGFIVLPAVAPKVWLNEIDITFLYNDLLTFGPFLTPIDSYNDVKVLNMDGTEFGTGQGTATGLGIYIDPLALPLLEVRAVDFEDDAMGAGRVRIKIDGVTGMLSGADADSFVAIPIDILDVPGGTYTVSAKLDDAFTYGPYPVSIQLGDLKVIKASDGAGVTAGPSGMTRLLLVYPVADLRLFAQNQTGSEVADGGIKALIPGVTSLLAEADQDGYIVLPHTLDKVAIFPVNITWTLGDQLVFGPYDIAIDKFGDVKVVNSDGTPFGTGAGAVTGLGVRVNYAALPVLRVSALDLENDPLATDRAKIKIVGFTETLPGADLDGYVPIPVDVVNLPGGTYSVSTKLDETTVYGPYDVTIQLGDVKEIKAVNGTANFAGPSTETRLIVRFDVADVLYQGANASGAPLPAGRVALKLTGITETLPGADANGFVDLPATVPDMLILDLLEATVALDDTATYGPYSVTIDKFKDLKIVNGPDGIELGTGAGPITEIRFKFGANQSPIADAGPDQALECLANSMYVTLDGSGSSDPDSDDLTYSWILGGEVIAGGDSAAAEKPTVLLPLGTHLITLTVDDGNQATDSDEVQVSITHDTTPPVVVITDPVEGSWVKAPHSVRVSGTVTEAFKLVSVTAGGKKAGFVGEAPDYTFECQVGGLPEGANVIDVVARDVSGNEGAAQVSYNIDATKPAVSFLTPVDQALILTSPVHVEVDAQDAHSGVATVTINGAAASLVSGTTYAADVAVTRDGDRKIWAEAIDNVGHKQKEFITVTFDDDPPVVRIKTPSKNSLVVNPSVVVIGTVSDKGSGVASVVVSTGPSEVPVVAVIDADGSWQATVPVPDGATTLTATATDAAGKVAVASVDVNVDTGSGIRTLSLKLKDSNGKKIVGARVDPRKIVNGSEKSGGLRQNTDSDGRVIFEVDASVIYRLRVTYNGGVYTTQDMMGKKDHGDHDDHGDDDGDDGDDDGDDDDGDDDDGDDGEGGGYPSHVNVRTELATLSLSASGGADLNGARVDLMKDDPTQSAGLWSKTGEGDNHSGEAEFQVLPGVGYRFKVSHLGGQVIVPAPGDPAAVGEGTQVVQTQAATLTLTDSHGSAIADVRVDLLKDDGNGAGEWVKTGANGVAPFEVLSNFSHRYRIRYNGGDLVLPALGEAAPVGGGNLPVSTVETVFTLKTSSGAPIEGARVDLMTADGKGVGVKDETDADGIARFEVLPGFQHLFQVHYHGGTYTTDEAVSVPAGSE